MTSKFKKLALSDGMMILEEAFGRARKIMEGYPHVGFNASEYMTFYECVYDLCIQKSAEENAQAIYARYEETLKDCVILLVFPLLESKRDVAMLTALAETLHIYKFMTHRLSKIFHYVDRYFTPQRQLPPLNSVSSSCFHRLVHSRFSNELQAATIALINQVRKGEIVDSDMIRTIVGIFNEAKSVGATCYNNFENAILADAAAYYSQMASYGLRNCSYSDYIAQACMCINQENERMSHCLDPSTRLKLLQVIKTELLDRVSGTLLEIPRAENSLIGNDYKGAPVPQEVENYLSDLMTRVNI